ncbi:MAG: sigma factor-like helix-turn-helix DNA-binding protein [Miltoncostaeaceae bacterium]
MAGPSRTPSPELPGDGPLIAAAGLTERQHDVYRLSRQGLSPAEIARELSVSDNTVRDCLAQVRRKVALALRRAEIQAAANAERAGEPD